MHVWRKKNGKNSNCSFGYNSKLYSHSSYTMLPCIAGMCLLLLSHDGLWVASRHFDRHSSFNISILWMNLFLILFVLFVRCSSFAVANCYMWMICVVAGVENTTCVLALTSCSQDRQTNGIISRLSILWFCMVARVFSRPSKWEFTVLWCVATLPSSPHTTHSQNSSNIIHTLWHEINIPNPCKYSVCPAASSHM